MISGNSEYRNAMASILYNYQTSEKQRRQEDSSQRFKNTEEPVQHLQMPYPDILQPLVSMGLSIKSQLDQVLPGQLAILGVSYPVFFSPRYQELLLLAVREASLHSTLIYHQVSVPLAVSAACAIDLCRCPIWTQACIEQAPWQDRLILSIDYSPNSLMIFLYNSFDFAEGVFYIRMDDPGEHLFFWSEVSDILTAFHNQKKRKAIDYVVLSGSLSSDKKLHKAIQKGLGSHSMPLLPPGSRLKTEQEEAGEDNAPFKLYTPRMADPLIAAAQGAAELAWRSTMKSCMDPCSQWRKLPQCLIEQEMYAYR